MLSKDIVFNCNMSPALAKVGNVTYVVPGWYIVPNDTTLDEVHKHCKEEQYKTIALITPSEPITKTVISKRTGEKYIVEFNGISWSCTCMGFGYRGKCKHIDQIK